MAYLKIEKEVWVNKIDFINEDIFWSLNHFAPIIWAPAMNIFEQQVYIFAIAMATNALLLYGYLWIDIW